MEISKLGGKAEIAVLACEEAPDTSFCEFGLHIGDTSISYKVGKSGHLKISSNFKCTACMHVLLITILRVTCAF